MVVFIESICRNSWWVLKKIEFCMWVLRIFDFEWWVWFFLGFKGCEMLNCKDVRFGFDGLLWGNFEVELLVCEYCH